MQTVYHAHIPVIFAVKELVEVLGSVDVDAVVRAVRGGSEVARAAPVREAVVPLYAASKCGTRATVTEPKGKP